MSKGGTTVVTPKDHDRPKDLFGAVAQLERYAFAEARGTDVDERYATIKDRLDYFTLGLRSQLAGAIVTLLLAPVSVGVMNNYIPIFGMTGKPSIIAVIYAYILSFSLSIGFALFFAYIGKFYTGRITKVIVTNLYVGATVGAFIKMLTGTVFYALLYFLLLSEAHIYSFVDLLEKYNVKEHTIDKVYYVTVAFKSVLMPTVWLVFVSTLIFVTLPWLSVAYTAYKSRKKEI